MVVMRKRLWISAGCLVFGISVLANMPAQLVIPESSGKLQLLGIGGSVWRGEVKQIVYDGKTLPVRDLKWKLRPTALFHGALEAEFHEKQSPENHGKAVLDLLSRQYELQAVQWQLPGSSLDPWFRAGVGLQGQFTLDLQTLRLPANGLIPRRMQGRIDWQGAALRMDSETWPIGWPLMQFSGEGDAIKGIITNSQPLLPGDSSFECTAESCRVDLSLQPAPEAPPSLSNVLLLLGLQQTGNRFSGQLTLPMK
jgi:hypothetical protein